MSSILLRVTQLNAVYLDQEIFKALQNLLHKSISYLPPGLVSPYERELNLLLRLAVIHYSVVKNGSTFGQQLLSIRYQEISPLKRRLCMILTCLGYFKDKMEIWQPTHKVNDTIRIVCFVLKVLDFINFTLFLCRGTKPRLIERVLGLNQVYTDGSTQRTFGSKYFARELMWNSVIEIIVHVLPLVNFHKLKRMIRGKNPFQQRSVEVNTSNPIIDLTTRCPCCQKIPVIPAEMGCDHTFCYVCLTGNLQADWEFACPDCGYQTEEWLVS